ncbi:MAG TPA: methyltransferase domain-containing protein [Acidobacteriaceae bacterium]|nr:methyltransferase domain-containing protein [Acidobacteriaceae bacterium]
MQKAYKGMGMGMGMEGSIARWYDKTTRKDMPEYVRVAERIDSLVPENAEILEVAPGPGFISIELARGGRHRVTGLDISHTFIDIARKNAAAAGVSVDFRHGNASEMPLEANSFDFVVCRAAFKNFTEPVKAIAEMYRVLRPGGQGVIIDLRRDTSMSEIANYVDNMEGNVLNGLFMKFTFRFMLIPRAYTVEQFRQMLAQVPFASTRIEQTSVGVGVWFEK